MQGRDRFSQFSTRKYSAVASEVVGINDGDFFYTSKMLDSKSLLLTANADTCVIINNNRDTDSSSESDTSQVIDTADTETDTTGGVLLEDLVVWYPLNGDAKDFSGNANHGTVHEAVSVANRFGNPNAAYRFQGTSYIDCGNDSSVQITDAFTISVWIRPDAFNSGNGGIVSKFQHIQLSNERAFSLMVAHSSPCSGNLLSNVPTLTLSSNGTYTAGGGPNCNIVCADTGLQLNNWVHLVAVYEANTGYVSLYMDGEPVAHESTNIVTELHNSAANLAIGYNYDLNDADAHFQGAIDDVRIYDRALNESEITQLYNVLSVSPEIN